MANRTIKAVLIAVDGSPHSLRALKYVASRARTDEQMRVCILNVQSPLPQSFFVHAALVKEYYGARSAAALKGARAFAARNRLDCETLVRVGDPPQTIVEVAKAKHCVEIVMGTRGLGSFKGLILGSVVAKVIHFSRIPVTVVP